MSRKSERCAEEWARRAAERNLKRRTFPCYFHSHCSALLTRDKDNNVVNVTGHTCLKREEREAQEEAAKREAAASTDSGEICS